MKICNRGKRLRLGGFLLLGFFLIGIFSISHCKNEEVRASAVDSEEGLIRILRDPSKKAVAETGSVGLTNHPWALGAASPSIIEFQGKIFFYFRGEGTDNGGSFSHSLPYVYTFTPGAGKTFNGTNWDEPRRTTPVFGLGETGADDDHNITALAVCVYDGKVYMFYRGVSTVADGNGNKNHLMYAISENGIDFVKQGTIDTTDRTIWNTSATVTSVHTIGSRIYMTYMGWDTTGSKYGDCFLTYSDDGGASWAKGQRILRHNVDTSNPDWTSRVLDTFRMYDDGEYLYIFFGGSFQSDKNDYPEGFGIARALLPTASEPNSLLDDKNWEMYPFNPIMIRGATGSIDEGAVWSFTVFEYGGKLRYFYEGYGTGTFSLSDDLTVPIGVRNVQYKYQRSQAFSHILTGYLNINSLDEVWDANPLVGQVAIQNVETDEYINSDSYDGLVLDEEPQEFTLTYQNDFFRIKDENGLYASPERNDVGDGVDFRFDGNAEIMLSSNADLDYEDMRGYEWEIYPVGNGEYKIQNRYTGNFLSTDGHMVKQSQETNEDAMIWRIIDMNDSSSEVEPTGDGDDEGESEEMVPNTGKASRGDDGIRIASVGKVISLVAIIIVILFRSRRKKVSFGK